MKHRTFLRWLVLPVLLLCLFTACTPAEPDNPQDPDDPNRQEEQQNPEGEGQNSSQDNIRNYIGIGEAGYYDDVPGLDEAIDTYYESFRKEVQIEEFPAELWEKATFERELRTIVKTVYYEKKSGVILSEQEYMQKRKADPDSVSGKAVRTHQTALVTVQLPKEAYFEFCIPKGITFYASSENGSWNVITPLDSSTFVKTKEAAAETYLYGLTDNHMLKENFGENWNDHVKLIYSKFETKAAFTMYKVQLEIEGKMIGNKGYGPFLFYVSNDGGNWHVESGLSFSDKEPGDIREWSPGILNPTEIALQYPQIPKIVVDAEVDSYGKEVGYWGESVRVCAFDLVCTHMTSIGKIVEVYEVQEQRQNQDTFEWRDAMGSSYLFFEVQNEERIFLERRINYPDLQDTVEELAEAVIHGTDSIHYAFRNQKLADAGNLRWYGLGSQSMELGQGELLERQTSTEAMHTPYSYREGMWYSDLNYWRSVLEPDDKSTWNVSYAMTTNPDVLTWRGIHVGSTREDVLNAYPEAHTEPYFQEEDIIWCNGYDHREEAGLSENDKAHFESRLGNAILFYFKENKVVKMEVITQFD
ncbi:MAG: hypothetical protein E7223_05540 [Clostridiales bacterium]|nr:hypothetical protein [Clostridiales bacterium]